jgi:iron complex outermembrane receptor protein
MWDLGGPAGQSPIKPETLSAFEVGYKYAASGLSFDLAAYYNDWKDIQVSNFELVGGSTLSIITNAAAAHIYGLEGQMRYNISREFEANLSAAYTHARYASFPDSPAYNQCLSAACAGPGFANFGSFVVSPTDATGDTLPRSPSLTSSLGLTYTTPLAGGKFGLTGNLYYTSKVYFDTSDQTSQGGYATLGLRAQWTDPSDHYTLALYGNNVTNRHYIGELLEITGAIGAVWAPPATVGGSIRIKF